MCIKWFEERKVPAPTISSYIDAVELKEVLKDAFGSIPILLPDHYYELATKASFCQFLQYDKTDQYRYTGDSPDGGFDCDDYACVLHGNASIPKWANVPIGTVWLSDPAHAVNVFVDENKEVWYIEPQDDSFVKVKEKTDWIPYIVWF